MQHVIVKFSPENTRTYTYHWQGEPLAPGDEALIETGQRTIKRVQVVEVRTPTDKDKPLGFHTKAVVGKAPPRTEVTYVDDDTWKVGIVAFETEAEAQAFAKQLDSAAALAAAYGSKDAR